MMKLDTFFGIRKMGKSSVLLPLAEESLFRLVPMQVHMIKKFTLKLLPEVEAMVFFKINTSSNVQNLEVSKAYFNLMMMALLPTLMIFYYNYQLYGIKK